MGEEALQDCTVWTKGSVAEPTKLNAVGEQTRLPWSGASLGTAGVGFLTARSEPKLVAVIGPHNAGKTTLLGLFYQHVGRSGRMGSAHFAGSYSLEGWEAIAHALRWEGNMPRFAPHTSSGAGRVPGLLHLAYRNETNKLSDVLFADSPGEWFHRWAIDPRAADAEGARWVVDRAATLIAIADCEALAGKDRGQARSDVIQLLRRLGSVRQGRPVALVWTKADVAVPSLIRTAVIEAALLVMPDIVEFEVSVIPIQRETGLVLPAEGVSSLLTWAVSPMRRGFDLPNPQLLSRDPFFTFGATA